MAKRKEERIVIGAGAFIIDSKDRILLIKSPFWKARYVIPGGTVEYGEHIFDTVKREAVEEVGLKVRPVGVLVVAEDLFPKDHVEKKHYVYFDILCRPISKKVKIDNFEVADYSWVHVKKALTLVSHPIIKRTINAYIKQKRQGKFNFIDIS